MPSYIIMAINDNFTPEERLFTKQLWNPSLPISANVGIIEYNRVDGEKFKEQVGQKYGDGWWMSLEDLVGELNEAAEVIKGKGKELHGETLNGDPAKGKGLEMKAVRSPEGNGQEPEIRNPHENGAMVQEPETKTLDHPAEAAVLVVETERELQTGAAHPTTAADKPVPTNADHEIIEAALNLLNLSAPLPSSSTPSSTILIANDPLSALWYVITVFFSHGPTVASYLFVALEAAIRRDSTTVHPLHIPTPPSYWATAVPWDSPKVGLTLILTLAASSKGKFGAFARFSKSLGTPALKAEEMRTTKSASLRKAVLRAKDDAEKKQRTTVLGVNLRDVLFTQLCEVHGKDIEKYFATFGRMFVLGVCPGGAKLWLVGGEGGETRTVWEGNGKMGQGVGSWEEMDEFVRGFEGFAVADVGGAFLLPLPSFPFLPFLPFPAFPFPSNCPTEAYQLTNKSA